MKRAVQNIIDVFKPVEAEVLECYQNKTPKEIEVKVKGDPTGKVWAEIRGFEKNDVLYTEAKNRSDLEEKVNDAVVTYYDIPYRYARYILVNKKYSDPELIHEKKKAVRVA